MSYQYWDAQGNNYVRGWGNDFTDAEKKKLGIGQYREEEVDPSRITQGKFQMPGLGNRIEDFLVKKKIIVRSENPERISKEVYQSLNNLQIIKKRKENAKKIVTTFEDPYQVLLKTMRTL